MMKNSYTIHSNESLLLLKESSITPKLLMIHNIICFFLQVWNVLKVHVCCFLQ